MPVERVSQGFKDLSMSLQANPLTSDILDIKNENAIARSLRNLVMTIPGERFFNCIFISDCQYIICYRMSSKRQTNVSKCS